MDFINTLVVWFGIAIDWCCGCAHRRKTFPMTLRSHGAGKETYVVCLDCGSHFAYDWSRMRITGRQLGWFTPALVPALAQIERGGGNR
jgi:hypothetical protein